MKLIEGKFYAIAYKGEFKYDGFAGRALYLGEYNREDKTGLFKIKPTKEFPNQTTAYFPIESVVGELKVTSL